MRFLTSKVITNDPMLKRVKNLFLDLLYPRQCVGCKAPDSWFCDHCALLIKKLDQQRCYVCKNQHPKGKTCDDHLNNRTLNKLLIAAHYSANPVLGDAIHELKYNRHPEDIMSQLGPLLCSTLNLNLHSHSSSFILIPVPLHPKRLKDRGFNQAELLTNEVLKHCPLLTANCKLIARSKHTESQVKSGSRAARLENLKDAFSVTEKPDPNSIYILIDDVATTGSTLEECAQTLRQAGAREVWGLVLARN